MNLRPLGDRVLIKRGKRDERSAGGIIIPETAADQERCWQGEVLAVGPGERLDNGMILEPRVKTGDKVLVGKYQGTTVELDGEELVVVRGGDIHGVVE